ncbi:MAG: sugar transferase [Dysgonamonadaceae bacterium]|jgi:lipopolysaccharide/colanic/teichoic acid biosynthesis glycosyltransferase|nr:sugar transferase [Dysgonamonadaceae bacterium]
MDVIGAFCGLVILSPLLLGITLYLFFTMEMKPFFFQRRTGIHGKYFTLIKFKTMKDDSGNDGGMTNKDRITKFGAFLRNTSIDEFPQLLHVVKGDMSLVGPRPLLPEYLPLYSETQRRRFEVLPGITGWAQINGRNTITWAQKFTYDVWYVDHLGFLLDMKILFTTIFKMFSGQDINNSEQQTMPKFNGSN